MAKHERSHQYVARRESSHQHMTVDEFLRFEEQSSTRHEYVEGYVYAMSGGTLNHNIIAGNVFAKLRSAGADKNCRTFINDVMVRASNDALYYPDVVVACGPLNGEDLLASSPCLVVEVTSPSSERIDRHEKLKAYLAAPSVKSYLIIEQDGRFVRHHSRDENGTWKSDNLAGNDVITLQCPQSTLSLDEIYDRVEFPTAKERLRTREEAAQYS